MNKDLGTIIKMLRKGKGWSVRALAEKAGINDTDVSKLERNKILKPSIAMLLSLSKALDSNLLAAYLEESEAYLYYKELIDCSVGLNQAQLQEVLSFINKIKEGI